MWIALWWPLFAFLGSVKAARILAVLPFHGLSHSKVLLPLFDVLADRGHQVTVVSYFPKKETKANYTSIGFTSDVPLKGFLSVTMFEEPFGASGNFELIYKIVEKGKELLADPRVLQLQNEKFDLVFTELFNTEIFFGLLYKLGAPYIIFHTTEPFPSHRFAMCETMGPSFIPNSIADRGPHMSFIDRFYNTVEIYWLLIRHRLEIFPQEQEYAEKHLGKIPSLDMITRNASMLFMNTHYSLQGPRPYNPQVVEVGGLHLKPSSPLPKDYQQLMDSSKQGVILFSLGSVLSGASLNDRYRTLFLKVFSTLEEIVLWKWEGDKFTRKKNIHLSPWLPQNDLFAHPNLKLFISHCGLSSIQEAVTNGIPVICIPLFGEQHFNGRTLAAKGAGLVLNFSNLKFEDLLHAVQQVLSNPKFKENAVRMQRAFNDRPMSPMDTAVYWTEHVIRHKGAPLLQSHVKQMSWVEFENVDVLFVLVTAFWAILWITLKMGVLLLKLILRRILGTRPKSKNE